MDKHQPLVDVSTLNLSELQGDDPTISASLLQILRNLDHDAEGVLSAFQSFPPPPPGLSV